MIIITNYDVVQKDKYYEIKHREKIYCPCGGRAVVRDTKRRIIYDASGEKYAVSLKRVKCKECGMLHTVIPDFIEPHKHYAKQTIQNVVHSGSDDCCADDSTIYRWKNEKPHPVCMVKEE